MKCFLDANVLFSGSNESSHLHRLLQTLGTRHEWITSDYAREEAIRNIRAKRSSWECGYTGIMRHVKVVESIDQTLIDLQIADKDRPILATAIVQQCDRLITGDKKDFGHLFGKEVQGVTIVTPLMWIRELTPM